MSECGCSRDTSTATEAGPTLELRLDPRSQSLSTVQNTCQLEPLRYYRTLPSSSSYLYYRIAICSEKTHKLRSQCNAPIDIQQRDFFSRVIALFLRVPVSMCQ